MRVSNLTAAVLVGLGSAISASDTLAATLVVTAGAGAQIREGFQNANDSDLESINSELAPNLGVTSATVDATASAALGPRSAVGQSTASANIETGELKIFGSTAPIGEPTNTGSSDAGASVGSIVSETFNLTGTGTLTLLMAVDVEWDIDGFWSFQADITTNFGRDFLAFGPSLDSPAQFSVDDHILSVSRDFTDAQNVFASATWRLTAELFGGSDGFIDASNTGTIFFETTGDLTATPSNGSFLNQAVFPADISGSQVPSPVPLPASAWLLAIGLAGLMRVRPKKPKGEHSNTHATT